MSGESFSDELLSADRVSSIATVPTDLIFDVPRYHCTMVWSPRVTVAAVIEDDGRFLCVEEHDQERRVINQPAGHLEPGESLIEAVRREVREETGREFDPHGLVGVYLWPLDQMTTYLRFCFAGKASRRLPELPLDPDIIETLWLDPAALRAQRAKLRSPLVLRCIEDSLRRPLVDLEALHDIVP